MGKADKFESFFVLMEPCFIPFLRVAGVILVILVEGLLDDKPEGEVTPEFGGRFDEPKSDCSGPTPLSERRS